MRFNTLDEWLAWQAKLHFTEIDLGLERVAAVWQALKSESFNSKIISVAGTNGKGSTVAFLESIYACEGYRVGTYTTPHLFRYTERIRINQQEVEEDLLCSAFEKIDQARNEISLSYFEFGTLAALLIFQEADLDVVILEVGLGGRLDAVNIVDADCAVITSIDLDHCEYLGTNREQIGLEKAGILRNKQYSICTDLDVPKSVLEYADSLGTHLYLLGKDISIRQHQSSWDCLMPALNADFQSYSLPYPSMRGWQQIYNASAAVCLSRLMASDLPISISSVRLALQTTNLPGRFSVVQKKCPWVLDVAHNVAAAKILAKNLTGFNCSGTTYAIFSAMADKDIEGLLTSLAQNIQHWFIVNLDNDRAVKCSELAKIIKALKLHGTISECESVDQALKQVIREVKESDLVVVYGSFATVSQAYQTLEQMSEK